jgi:MFS family permease
MFFITEALTALYWGWWSDRIGRKPIFVLGPFGLGCAMLSFGFARTFWAMVVSRAFQGIFNGNIGMGNAIILLSYLSSPFSRYIKNGDCRGLYSEPSRDGSV